MTRLRPPWRQAARAVIPVLIVALQVSRDLLAERDTTDHRCRAGGAD
jgi:hypothetical protein